MILLIDNYDSFTYNLYQYLCELGAEVRVVRNDEVTVDEVAGLGPEKIVVSPGPKRTCLCSPPAIRRWSAASQSWRRCPAGPVRQLA